jgi:hypothetical protein
MNETVIEIPVIRNIDYKRLKKIEAIKNHHINKYSIDILKEDNNKKSLFFKLFIINFLLFLAYNILFYLFKNETNTFAIFIKENYEKIFSVCFVFLLSIIAFKSKINKVEKIFYIMKKSKSDILKTSFFIEELKGSDLEIKESEIAYYEIFLKRFIEYNVLKTKALMKDEIRDFFKKDYASDLTMEELFISVAYFQFDIEEPIDPN